MGASCSSCFQGLQTLGNQSLTAITNVTENTSNFNTTSQYHPDVRFVKCLPEPVKCLPELQPGVVGSLDGKRGKRGRRRALLIGINYVGTRAELQGCVNDVRNIEQLLQSTFGFKPSEIRILTDEDATRYNIMDSEDFNTSSITQWLLFKDEGGLRSGDCLFLLYSGHGSQQIDPNGLSEDGMLDTILPIDFQKQNDFQQNGNNMITDNELHQRFCREIPQGVKVTIMIDACHSGTMGNLSWNKLSHYDYKTSINSNDRDCSEDVEWREETNPFHLQGDIILLSGCRDDQTSSDGALDRYGRRGGALTTAFVETIRNTNGNSFSYCELLEQLRESMVRNGYSQVPQMTSSQAFDADKRMFSLVSSDNHNNHNHNNISLNLNLPPTIPSSQLNQQLIRRRFPPKPQPYDENDPLHLMLMEAGMLVVEELLENGTIPELLGGALDIDVTREGEGFFGGLLGGLEMLEGDMIGGMEDVVDGVEDLVDEF